MRFSALLCLLLLCCVPTCGLWPAEPPLATPAATANQWKTDAPAASAAAARQAEQTAALAPEPGGLWIEIGKWALGAVGLAIAVAKLMPKGPLADLVVNLAGKGYDLIVPGRVRDAEKRQADLAVGMLTVAHLIQLTPNTGTIGDLKADIANRLPAGALDALNAYITEMEKSGVQALTTGTGSDKAI